MACAARLLLLALLLAGWLADARAHPGWPEDPLDWRDAAVDLSFLNRPEAPAGRRGFVRAEGERLVFGDGTPARFWGTNLTAAALFGTSREGVRRQARRLSRLGFNLVRLHHHDSPWVDPNVFGPAGGPDTRSLAAAQMERLDWWIKCLKDEGIYVWLDLHVLRRVKPGDGIRDFAELARGGADADLKGYVYVDPDMRRAMKDFARAFLGHRNVHTGLRYVDDPAVAVVLVTNENDLTGHYGNALLPDKGVPAHSAAFLAEARRFAAARGLPADETWRAWKPGPSKFFLNDLEARFADDMIASLRSLGLRVPIVTTSLWGGNSAASLPALTRGDLIDVHIYGRAGELEKDPLRSAGLVDNIALAQVAGKPLSVSEWNAEPFPVDDRHVLPLLVAAHAARQGWDAVLLYAWAQVPLDGPGRPSNWHAFNDPALVAGLPAAALLYRRGDLREAERVFAWRPTREQLFFRPVDAATAARLRAAAATGRLVTVMPAVRELPWLQAGSVPPGAEPVAGPGEPGSPGPADGQLRRDWERGLLTVATPLSQAAAGRMGGREIRLPDVSFTLATENAALAVQSLDGRPIRESRRLLLSLAGRSLPASPRDLPFRSEPWRGEIRVAAPPGLALRVLDAPGSPAPAIEYGDGRYRIRLDGSLRGHWLLLSGRSPPRRAGFPGRRPPLSRARSRPRRCLPCVPWRA